DKVYIKDAQGCCEKVNNDTGPPEVYGLRTQNCCNGTVYHANRYACCTRHDKSQILYNPLTQNCCIDPAVKNSHRNVHGGLCEIKKGKRSCCIPLKSQVFHRRRRRRHHPHYDLERKSEVGFNLSLDQGDAEADHLEEDGSADDCTGAAKFGMDSKLCFAGSRLGLTLSATVVTDNSSAGKMNFSASGMVSGSCVDLPFSQAGQSLNLEQ
ncbi:unnamed protein product, partial [Polarella glacialis]